MIVQTGVFGLSVASFCSFDVVRTLTDSGKDIVYLEQEMGGCNNEKRLKGLCKIRVFS